jgi:hypothetical protein
LPADRSRPDARPAVSSTPATPRPQIMTLKPAGNIRLSRGAPGVIAGMNATGN